MGILADRYEEQLKQFDRFNKPNQSDYRFCELYEKDDVQSTSIINGISFDEYIDNKDYFLEKYRIIIKLDESRYTKAKRDHLEGRNDIVKSFHQRLIENMPAGWEHHGSLIIKYITENNFITNYNFKDTEDHFCKFLDIVMLKD